MDSRGAYPDYTAIFDEKASRCQDIIVCGISPYFRSHRGCTVTHLEGITLSEKDTVAMNYMERTGSNCVVVITTFGSFYAERCNNPLKKGIFQSHRMREF
jgi:hypothetical protein